jgi:hypothetical protein
MPVGVSDCVPGPATLCLNNNRFRVEMSWSIPSRGRSGAGTAVPLTGDTGYFWFFGSANIELVIKVLDGRPVNGNFWVFYGALSNVQYRIIVTDTQTGAAKSYDNPSGNLASVADTSAFPPGTGLPEGSEALLEPFDTRATEELYGLFEILARATAEPAVTAPCTAGITTLCLNQSRFQASVDWSVPSQGRSGHGIAVPVTSDTGYFWFLSSANVELVIKVLDGRSVNGHFWVFSGALSAVQYTITITDTQTGAVKTYDNASGHLASLADTSGF